MKRIVPTFRYTVKGILAVLPLLAVPTLPSSVSAQVSDGLVNEVAFKGTSGTYGGLHLPYYKFDITGMPGTPYWDFLCVDNLNYIHWGDVYDARFTSVESGDLGLTREGSDQLRAGQPLSKALKNYRIGAYLYLQAQGADNATLAGLQKAAWYATNPGYGSGNNGYYATAKAAVEAGFKADYFYVVTATADLKSDGKIRATGGTQEYLVYATPEPSTIILLGTGLAGMAFIGRRRRLENDPEEAEA